MKAVELGEHLEIRNGEKGGLVQSRRKGRGRRGRRGAPSDRFEAV